ncbi:MAG: hypothetical protein QOG89_1392 [Thermomicrobiales bacterium]|nr:hypothetical protein [Thermomicrobiales bacterium]
MGTPRRIRIGLVLALLAFFSLNLLPPSPTFAQDEEGASEPPATQEEPAPPADTTPPSIGQPLDIVVAAEDATGAWVTYVVPEAIDERDGAVPVACAPEPGLRFPLGTTKVKCAAQDAAENRSTISFLVTVADQTPPVIDAVGDVVADATDAAGAAVNFPVPGAWDNVDGAVAIGCDFASGAVFPVGTTVVTCWAQDNANNQANPVSFAVTVNALPEPVPTDPPTEEPTEEPSQVPTETPTEEPTETPTTEPTVVSTEVPTTEPTKTPKPTKPPTEQPSETPTDGPTPTRPSTTPSEPTQAPTPTDVPTPPATGPTPIPTPEGPAALELPPIPPDGFVLVTDGGPVGLLASVWGNDEYPISQEFGHTDFSVAHPGWYAYGLGYGLDGYEHTGLDVGMPAGTPLYSPVEGTVAIAGGTPYFTFYGNGRPGVGELLIRTADGDEVVLGHMGRIAVEEGDRVKIGQFVGLSGGENGDHLHLEVRELQPEGGLRILDPRKSFLVDALEAAAKRKAATPEATTEGGAPRERPID